MQAEPLLPFVSAMPNFETVEPSLPCLQSLRFGCRYEPFSRRLGARTFDVPDRLGSPVYGGLSHDDAPSEVNLSEG
jgi:hypothetical protein